MSKFAARVGDMTMHPLPGALAPGPGSFNVLIGNIPAWRGVNPAIGAAMAAAKAVSDAAVVTAEATTASSLGAALPAEQALKAATITAFQTAAAASGADIHICATIPPAPGHGPGVVIDGSATVSINNLAASRIGDTVLEALGPPNKIVMACMNVMIGG
jgi:uncharacterized Zn-binding protein involved in type VI secretion